MQELDAHTPWGRVRVSQDFLQGRNPQLSLEPAQEQGTFQALSLSRGSVSHINRKNLALPLPLSNVMQDPALGGWPPREELPQAPDLQAMRFLQQLRREVRPLLPDAGAGHKGAAAGQPRDVEIMVVLLQQSEDAEMPDVLTEIGASLRPIRGECG